MTRDNVDAMVPIACNKNANSSTLRARATAPANLPAPLRAGIVLEVGGDNSWGARPQSRHQLKPGDTYELELKLHH